MPGPATRRLFLRHDPRPAELAVACGHHAADGNEARARHAAALYLDGLVPRVLFTGGGGEAERMADVAVARGVPPADVLLETASRTTFENAALSCRLLAARGLLQGLKTALLVSCPWHMGRVARVMRRAFPPGVELLCCPHLEHCSPGDWQLSAECCRRVAAEAELLDALIRRGALPEDL